MRRVLRRALIFIALMAAAALLPRAVSWALARGDVVRREADLPRLRSGEHLVAIVPGAGVVDRRPTPLLQDRIDAAVRLLEQGRVDLLLMSGDNATPWYDEPSAMRRRALELGAAPQRVAVDYAGRRTWDTCVRAHDVFGVRHAVLVTSAFHVDRAVMTCSAAGIDASGLSVDDGEYTSGHRARWRLRELAATARAISDGFVTRPDPAVGGDPVDPYDPCELHASLAPSVADASADTFRKLGCSASITQRPAPTAR